MNIENGEIVRDLSAFLRFLLFLCQRILRHGVFHICVGYMGVDLRGV